MADETKNPDKELEIEIDDAAMITLVAKANVLQRGLPDKIEICGKKWHLRPVSMYQNQSMLNKDFDVMYWQRKIKEAKTAKAAKRYSTKIRKAYAQKAAHRVLGKRLCYLPFVFAVMWRRIYAMSEEVSATINSLNALCAFEKDFYLANLGTSKQALALSMKQVGKAVEQRQERMESAISMLEKDASPKKEEGNKS